MNAATSACLVALCHVLITFVLAATGCSDPVRCTESGCGFTQTCNEETGLCEQRVSDCRKNLQICQEDEFCNQATGRCISSLQQCGRDQISCPPGQTCDAEAGICRPEGLCRTNMDCRPGEQCGLTGSCEPIRCSANIDCTQQPGFVCIGQRCEAGCQLPDNPCPEGSFCLGSSASTPGECIDSCTSNQDCNFGYFCDTSLARPTCILEPPCEDDIDCRTDELCRQQQCQAAPCELDEDCLDGQVCDRARCVGGDCQEDTFSPNHMPEEASLIEGEVEISNLVRCAGRPDWYRLDVDAGEVLEIELIHMANQDLDLYLLDANLSPLAQNQGQRTRIALDYEAPREQTLYLYIESSSFESSFYSLRVARSPASRCQEDSFEENDSASEAFRLFLQDDTPLNLAITTCFADEDWFLIPDLDADNGLNISWSGAAREDVSIDLFTPDGAIHAVPPTSFRQLRVHTPGSYFVRARNRNVSRQHDLNLSVTVQSPYMCIDANNYNTPANAFALPASTPTQLLLCPVAESWEVDWLRLDRPEQEPATLQLTVTSNTPDFPLEVVLFELTRPDGPEQPIVPITRRRAVKTASQQWEIQTVASPTQELALRISSQEPLGRIINPNFYTISYTYK